MCNINLMVLFPIVGHFPNLLSAHQKVFPIERVTFPSFCQPIRKCSL